MAIVDSSLDRSLRRALVELQFRVAYQPQVRLDEGTVSGFEAYLRWEHPQRGLVAPTDFLAVAKETGLIVPIGSWVLEQACEQAAAWRDEIPDSPRTFMTVNLSARELSAPDLVARVGEVLEATSYPAELLCLDVSADALHDDDRVAAETLRGLHDLGVVLVIDDFNLADDLSHLDGLPFDAVKLDVSLISGLGNDRVRTERVAMHVREAHARGLSVTAEGVETEAQMLELENLGCDRAQGFYFAHPQSAQVVTALLRRRLHWRHHASGPAA